MPSKLKTFLLALGAIAAVVLPGGFLIPAVYFAFMATRSHKPQPAALKEQ